MKKILIIISSIVGFLVILFIIYWFFILGMITITTNVPDSKIIITDGVGTNLLQKGNGSLETKIKRGNYQISVERSGYVNYTKKINVFGFQTKEIKIDLKSLPETSAIQQGVTTLERDADKKNLLFAENSGKTFTSLDPETNSRQILSRVDFGAQTKVKWSPNRYLAYIWRQDGTAGVVDLKRYDLLNQEFHVWPGVIQDLAWSNYDKEVSYIYKPGNGEFSLVKASPANENIERLVLHLDKQGMTDPYLEYMKNDKDLMLCDKNIFIYNFYTHELKKITDSGNVKMARLSFSGKYIVYTTVSETYLVKIDGTEKKRIGDGYDRFEWMPNGEDVVGIQNGLWRKINVPTGMTTEYAYNGSRIKDVKAITTIKGTNSVYYISGTTLYSLELQPKTVVLD